MSWFYVELFCVFQSEDWFRIERIDDSVNSVNSVGSDAFRFGMLFFCDFDWLVYRFGMRFGICDHLRFEKKNILTLLIHHE